MKTTLKVLSGLCLTTALVAGVAVSSARAGFEWNPPPAKAAPAVQAAQPQTMSDMAGGPLMPMPGEGAPIAPVDAADLMDNGNMFAPVKERNASSPVMLQGGGQDVAIVEGFGNDIPLAMALRQVVPPAYTISFAPGLDQGKPVSWNGGKAWTEVVNEMLGNRQLHANLNGSTILVGDGRGSPMVLPADAPSSLDNAPILAGGVVDMTRQSRWEAKQGQSLQETLESWSQKANVELAWQGARDVPIGSAFSYEGTFDQAVDSLLSLYSGGANEPMGKLYPNLPQGPSVLVIGANN